MCQKYGTVHQVVKTGRFYRRFKLAVTGAVCGGNVYRIGIVVRQSPPKWLPTTSKSLGENLSHGDHDSRNIPWMWFVRFLSNDV